MCLLLVEFSARAKENLNPIDLPGVFWVDRGLLETKLLLWAA